MTRRWIAAALAAIGLAARLRAAEPEEKKPDAPKPPPETEQLSYFMGLWAAEGEMKAGPQGSGGALQAREMCRFMPGRFFLACMAEARTAGGVTQIQSILGYDADKKSFVGWSFDNEGHSETLTGALKDGTWTWLGETKRGGQAVKTRYVMSDTKPDGYAFRFETSPDGKTWTEVVTSKYTKSQGRPNPAPGARPPGARPPAPMTSPAAPPAAAPTPK